MALPGQIHRHRRGPKRLFLLRHSGRRAGNLRHENRPCLAGLVVLGVFSAPFFATLTFETCKTKYSMYASSRTLGVMYITLITPYIVLEQPFSSEIVFQAQGGP